MKSISIKPVLVLPPSQEFRSNLEGHKSNTIDWEGSQHGDSKSFIKCFPPFLHVFYPSAVDGRSILWGIHVLGLDERFYIVDWVGEEPWGRACEPSQCEGCHKGQTLLTGVIEVSVLPELIGSEVDGQGNHLSQQSRVKSQVNSTKSFLMS